MSNNLTEPILVLPGAAHGIPVEAYVELLRKRLPDPEVRFARSRNQQRQLITNARIVTGNTIQRELLAHAEELRVFACRSAGTNHLP